MDVQSTHTHTHTRYQRTAVCPMAFKQPQAFSLLQVKFTYVSLSLSLPLLLSLLVLFSPTTPPLWVNLRTQRSDEEEGREDEDEGRGEGGEPEGNEKADDDEEEAATGKPVLELSVGLYRQISTHIYTQAHTQPCTNTPQGKPGKCVHVYFALKHSVSHIRTNTHTQTQMNQAVNAKCLLSECLQNKSCFQLLPLPLAGTLIRAQGSMQTLPHTHSHLSKCAPAHGCKYQDLLSVFRSHTHMHTQRHLFTMVMSCSTERTSVAARPC